MSESRFLPGLRYAAAGALCFSIMSALAKLVGARIPVQEIILIRGIVFGAFTLSSSGGRG